MNFLRKIKQSKATPILKRHLTDQSRDAKLHPTYAPCQGLTQQVFHGAPCDITRGQTRIYDVKTPACLLHLDTIEDNCHFMQQVAARHHLDLRAHTKTHKTLEIAEMQVRDQLEKRIEVSTLAEAWYFAGEGFHDVLYGVPLSPSKVAEIYEISKVQAKLGEKEYIMSVIIESMDVLHKLMEFSEKYEPKYVWNCFVKVDAGYHRAGIDITNPKNEKELVHLCQSIQDSPFTALHGLYSYSGQTYCDEGVDKIRQLFETERKRIVSCKEMLESKGIKVNILSAGSTPVAAVCDTFEGVTEIHPGNYVFYDTMQQGYGVCQNQDIGLSVLTRIIGAYPDRNELLVDLGSVALSHACDDIDVGNYGSIVGYPNLKLYSLSQEVGKIKSRDGSRINFSELKRDTCLRILPYHSCLTACQFPYYYVTNDKEVIVDVYNRVLGW